MKQKIKNFIARSNILNIFSIFFYIFRIFKIKNNRIVCVNFSGRGYGDSPKYIVEELLKDNNQYEIIWAVKSKKLEKFPEGIEVVKINSIKYFYKLSTARVWINNSRFPVFVRKRKKQYYIQTWHSPLRLKTIEMDAYENLSEYYKKVMINDSKNIDLMLSGCDFSYNIYKNSFMYSGKILKCGTPRCDIFFNSSHIEEMRRKFLEIYGIDATKRIILYAPTFRKNSNFEKNMLDLDEFINNLNKSTENILLVRFHPSSKMNIDITNNNIIDVSKYPDIQELLCVADILITDYSSCSFDMLIAKKICILYIPDVEEYMRRERKLYFNFEELPFPKVKTKKELIEKINNLDDKIYLNKVEKFEEKIGLYENGQAAKEVVKKIKEVVKNEKI